MSGVTTESLFLVKFVLSDSNLVPALRASRTGMLLNFYRYARKLQIPVVRIGGSTQASLSVILVPLEDVPFL